MGCAYSKSCNCSCKCRCFRQYGGKVKANRKKQANRGTAQHDTQEVLAFAEKSLEVVPVPSHNFRLEYAVLTLQGHYPDSPGKINQDSYRIETCIQGNPNIHFFGVFDGHGQFGAECSRFAKDRLLEKLSSEPTLSQDPVKAYNNAFIATNEELHSSDVDDMMSGTTAITVLVVGDTVYVGNVGDSRAVIAVKDGNQIVAEDLSRDQTPFRKDEYERVKSCGARVLSVDQVEGNKDANIQTWGDEETEGGDPPRLWVQNGMYPGTAFTRSIGDHTAETIGVIAVPEVKVVQLTADHLFFVVASDGVFEFLSSQAVVDLVAKFADPRDACSAVAGESYKLWLANENRTDDITLIIVHVKGLSRSGSEGTDGNDAFEISGNGGSDMYYSAASATSELQSGQSITLQDQSAATVAPSPTHSQP
ncbi:hypothetical protein Dimus_001393 [Dionaea muscipula]